jgi:hypothetical protein
MTRRQAALAVALTLTAHVALAQDDRAVPRGGGSSGGSGGHHPSPGASSSSAGGSSGGSDYAGRSGGSSHDPTPAQRRHPRAGTGSGHGKGGVYYYGAPYYGSPYYGYGYYGSPFYGAWGYGYYSPYYYSGFYGYSPYYYGSRSSRTGSVRVLVEPTDTRVYVDGYYAGVVDDFDGIFQRLNVAPGRHDISLRLDGHRTQNFKVYVPYDQTIKIHHEMVRGAPGEVSEQVIGRAEDVADAARREQEERSAERDEFDPRAEDELGPATSGDAGILRLEVQPTDASIYVDGAFRGTGRMRSLRLPAGRHRIEVVRPGYRTLEREVEIEPGGEVEVRFELDRS